MNGEGTQTEMSSLTAFFFTSPLGILVASARILARDRVSPNRDRSLRLVWRPVVRRSESVAGDRWELLWSQKSTSALPSRLAP